MWGWSTERSESISIFLPCGTLRASCVCQSLARLGANTLGIDASSSNVQIATLHACADPSLASASHGHTKGKLAYQHTTVEQVLRERGDGAFDVVCSMEVLEHVDNPRQFLSSCAQLVKVSAIFLTIPSTH